MCARPTSSQALLPAGPEHTKQRARVTAHIRRQPRMSVLIAHLSCKKRWKRHASPPAWFNYGGDQENGWGSQCFNHPSLLLRKNLWIDFPLYMPKPGGNWSGLGDFGPPHLLLCSGLFEARRDLIPLLTIKRGPPGGLALSLIVVDAEASREKALLATVLPLGAAIKQRWDLSRPPGLCRDDKSRD